MNTVFREVLKHWQNKKKKSIITPISVVTFNVYAQLDEGAVFADYAIAPVSKFLTNLAVTSLKF